MLQKLFGRPRSGLTPTQAEEFRQRGFLGPFTAFSPEQTAEACRTVCERVLPVPTPHSSYPSQVRHLDSRAVWDLCSAPVIVDKLRSLYGPDLILWYSNIFDKSPARRETSGEYPWHQDRWHWKLEPMVSLSVWLALTEATVENGCVEVIPGTHKREIPTVRDNDPRYASWFGGMVADPAHFDESKKVPLVMNPGEFFLFNEGTLHHSNPNRTDARRIGLSFRVTVPMVRTYRDTPGVLLCGRDRMGLNDLAAPPRGEPVLERDVPLPDAAGFAFDKPVLGAGWHLPERDGDSCFCWTGPTRESWLDLRARAKGPHRLRCQILYSLRPEMLATLKLHVNGEAVPLSWSGDGRFVVCEGPVSAEAMAKQCGRVRVTFAIDDVARPCDVTAGSGDTRELGLGIASLALVPAAAAKAA